MVKKFYISILVVMISCLMFHHNANADWGDLLDFFSDETPQITGLSESEIVMGLKEAITQGVDVAINRLGKVNGFYSNPQVRIPMPENLQKVESTLRTLKQDHYADEFHLSMNRAAEQAVPVTRSIFIDAIRNMSISDARQILNGPDNAATEYFRKSSNEKLTNNIYPIVREATNRVGVTRKYKSMVDQLGFMSSVIDSEALDIDGYITDKTLDGLFYMVAREEKRIRQDPLARTTELLKKVFQ